MLALPGVRARRVKTFVALAALNGSAGQGHGAEATGVLARVNFTDDTQAVIRLEGSGAVHEVASTGDVPVGTNTKITRFSLPTQNVAGDAAFVATLKGGEKDGAVIFAPTAGAMERIARAGESASGVSGAKFASFKSCAVNEEQAVAFLAETHRPRCGKRQ